MKSIIIYNVMRKKKKSWGDNLETQDGVEELKKFFKELQEALLEQLALIEKWHEQNEAKVKKGR